MRQLSGSAREQIFSQNTGSVAINLLDIEFKDNQGVVSTLRFCDQYQNVTSNGVVYEAAAFAVTLGRDIDENLPKVNLTFHSGDRQVINWLRDNNEPPKITINVVFSGNPSSVEVGPLEFSVERFDITSSLITMSLTLEPLLNEPFPSIKYTPRLFPQLWEKVI